MNIPTELDEDEQRYADPWGLSDHEQMVVSWLLFGFVATLIGAVSMVGWFCHFH